MDWTVQFPDERNIIIQKQMQPITNVLICSHWICHSDDVQGDILALVVNNSGHRLAAFLELIQVLRQGST